MATCLLVACSAGSPKKMAAVPEVVQPHPSCRPFVNAWVEHFRANVESLSRTGTGLLLPSPEMDQARAGLADAGIHADACVVPYCIIQPQGNGRLESYCGYRLPDPSGDELYRWIPHG